jgi:hypothetical protein
MAQAATITGKLVNIIGANAAEEGSVIFALCGYGSQVPRVTDTAVVARLTTLQVEADQNGVIQAQLWGNDWITPPGTYYTATVLDDNGDVQQCNAYVFLGDQSYDLGTTQPFDPTQPQGPMPPLIVNQLLMVPYSPNPVFPGDQALTFGMTLTGDVAGITFTGLAAGNLYTFIITQDSTGGRQFNWGSWAINATQVNPAAGSTTIQTFVAIASGQGPMIAIGPGTYYP